MLDWRSERAKQALKVAKRREEMEKWEHVRHFLTRRKLFPYIVAACLA